MKNTAYNRFSPVLRKVSLASWALKIIPIPIGIISAALMADVVSAATEGDVGLVLIYGAVLLTVAVGMKIFDILTGIAYQKASSRSLHKCKLVLYRQFLSNPLSALYKSAHGETIERLNEDFATVTGKSVNLYPSFWTGIVTAVAYFGFILSQNIFLALSLLGISLLQIIPPIIIKRFMQVNYDNCKKIEEQITDFTVEGYRGFTAIKLYGLREWWFDRLKALHKKYTKIGNDTNLTCRAEEVMTNLLDNILRYGSYALVGLFVLFGHSTLETGIRAIALSGGLFGAVKTVFESIPDFAVVKIAEKRLSDWFGGERAEIQPIHTAEVRLNGIDYRYGDNIIFNHADAVIDCSRITLIRGANGAGKSTLFGLIAGLVDAEGGSVETGGVNPASIAADELPRKLFYMPQDDAVFDFTAMELYTMIVTDKVGEAAKTARAFGLTDTLLGESKLGVLSGGERKKVYLSLALTVDPSILLLDEPTNSLDDKGKHTLCSLLQKRSGGAVIITHDAVFDGIAERVYRIDKGGICLER